jgi:periplasmic copper chaperone A
MSPRLVALLAGFALVPSAALAHVSIISGPATANASVEITFGVGHGCATDDTYSVRVEIPAGVTGLRTETSDFGKATVEKDASGNVIAVLWQKAEADLLPGDTGYYKLTLRAKLPNTPFTSLYFPARQTCKSATGTLSVVDWKRIGAQPTDAGTLDEPSPVLLIVPAHKLGWNKYTVPAAIADVGSSGFFNDARILWRGTEAFSSNPATVSQIESTAGVGKLTSLEANQEIWVKY